MPNWGKWFATDEDVAEREQADSAEFIRVVAAAVPFLEVYRERLLRRSRTVRWERGMGQEQAAANLIAQTVLLEQIEELDKMVREAKEPASG